MAQDGTISLGIEFDSRPAEDGIKRFTNIVNTQMQALEEIMAKSISGGIAAGIASVNMLPKSMETSLNSIEDSVTESNENIRRSFSQIPVAAEEETKKTESIFSKAFDNIGKNIAKGLAIGVTAGTGAFATLAGASLNAMGDIEQSIGGIETLFKNSADVVIQNAENAYMTAGVSANRYMEQAINFSATLLQGLGGDTAAAAEYAQKAILQMSDNANKMGNSIESIQNAYRGLSRDTYVMLDNLSLGYGGTAGEMARLVNDSGVLNGAFEVTSDTIKDVPFNILIDALQVTQDRLGITGTTAYEAAETLNGAMASATAAFKNFMSGAGDASSVVTTFLNAAEQMSEKLLVLIPQLTTGLAEIIAGVIPFIPGMIQTLLPPFIEGVKTLLSGLLEQFPSLIKAIAIGIADAIPILEPISELITQLSDNFEELIPTIGGLVAAFLAFKTIKFVLDVMETFNAITLAASTATDLLTISTVGAKTSTMLLTDAQKKNTVVATLASAAAKIVGTVNAVMAGQVTLATIAHTALAAAMNAVPFIAIITAVGALATGIIYLVKQMNKENAETKALKENTEDLVSKQQELTESAKDSAESYRNSFESLQDSQQVTKELKDEIVLLANGQDLTAQSATLLNEKIEMLNEAVPGLSLSYDDMTKSLSMSTEEMEAYLAAAEAQAELDMQLAESNRLKQEAIRIELELTAIEAQRAIIEEDLLDLSDDSRYDRKEMRDQLAALTESEDYYTLALQNNAIQQDALNPKIENNSEALSKANSVIEEATRKATEEQRLSAESVEVWADAQEEAADRIQTSFESFSGYMTDIFTEINTETGKTLEQITENLKSNQESMSEWINNLDTLSKKGLHQGIIQQLKDAGVEAAETVKNLITEDDFSELNKLFESGIAGSLDLTQKDLGLSGNADTIQEMFEEMTDVIIEDKGLSSSMMEKIKELKTNASMAVKVQRFDDLGTDMTAGLIKGINNGATDLNQAMTDLMNGALEAARTAVDSHSPSKKTMEIADDMADGFTEETERRIPDASAAWKTLATEAFGTFEVDYESAMADFTDTSITLWEDYNNSLFRLSEQSGTGRINLEINNLDELIRTKEEGLERLAEAEEIAAKERAIEEAETEEERLKAQEEYNKLMVENELEALKERKDNLERMLDEIVSAYDRLNNAIVEALTKKYKEMRDNELNDLKDFYDTQSEMITNAYEEHVETLKSTYDADIEYIKQTAEARKDAADEQYDAEVEALERAKESRREALEQQIDDVKSATDEIVAQYKRQYDAAIASMTSRETDEIQKIQDEIDAINALTEAEDAARKAKEDQQKLADLFFKITQANSDEERLEAQAAYDKEAERQQREALLQERKNEIDSLKEQMTIIKDGYKERKEQAKQELEENKQRAEDEEDRQLEHLEKMKKQSDDDYKARKKALDEAHKNELEAIADYQKTETDKLKKHHETVLKDSKESYDQQMKELEDFYDAEVTKVEDHYDLLLEKQNLQAEASLMIVEGNQEDIIALLDKYVPLWGEYGLSAGEAFLKRLQGVTPSIEAEVEKIMGLISQADSVARDYVNTPIDSSGVYANGGMDYAPSGNRPGMYYPDYSAMSLPVLEIMPQSLDLSGISRYIMPQTQSIDQSVTVNMTLEGGINSEYDILDISQQIGAKVAMEERIRGYSHAL